MYIKYVSNFVLMLIIIERALPSDRRKEFYYKHLFFLIINLSRYYNYTHVVFLLIAVSRRTIECNQTFIHIIFFLKHLLLYLKMFWIHAYKCKHYGIALYYNRHKDLQFQSTVLQCALCAAHCNVILNFNHRLERHEDI